ncbi:MAG TPA: hypothetical protein VGI84_00770 [Pseudonocardiaceae bacterium]|jgi:hypothetical protein
MPDDRIEIAAMVDGVLDRWREMRSDTGRAAGDRRFRSWLFETVPAQTAAVTGPDGGALGAHCYLVFEVASVLVERQRVSDAFLLLRWIADHYVDHPDADNAARVIMCLTDNCAQLGQFDNEKNQSARQLLRAVADSVRDPVDIRVERAVARALVCIGQLRGSAVSSDSDKTAELAALWTEVNVRWHANRDPELGGRARQALWNKGLLWLQRGRDKDARREFEKLLRQAGSAGHGVRGEADEWVVRARHAPALLDAVVIPPPALHTEYLRRQRHFDRRRQRRSFGIPWLLAGAPRNQMRALVRGAGKRHQVSAGMVRSWVCEGEPFVLLLRNFELTERSGTSALARDVFEDHETAGDHVRMISFRASQEVLSELVTGVSLVQVASTTAGELELTPFPGQFVAPNQLYLPDATWFDTVTTLMALAEQVIVWADTLTDPLARELDALPARDRAADTTVILEERKKNPAVDVVLPAREGEPLSPDHPALTRFPNVVTAEQFEGKRVQDCPALMRLVGRLEARRREPVQQRIARLRERLDAELAG